MIINPFVFSGSAGYDVAADAYFAAITAAGSSISTANKNAVNAFIVGCKADASPIGGVSNWSAMKEACILAASDDYLGALVPLRGSAPTNNGFTNAHYSRTGGLTSASSRYLLSARNNDASAQNSHSMGLYLTATGAPAAGNRFMATTPTGNTSEIIGGASATKLNPRFRNQSSTLGTLTVASGLGFIGVSRSVSTGYEMRAWGTQSTFTDTSAVPKNSRIGIFADAFGAQLTPGTYQFYWIGDAVDLAALDARITTLIAALT